MIPEYYSFPRYLAAKKSVDDRALNRNVLDSLRSALQGLPQETTRPLRILEVGAGIGTMIDRLLDWDLLPARHFERIEYTAVEAELENITCALERLPEWASARGYQVIQPEPFELHIRRPGRGRRQELRLRFELQDVYAFTHQAQPDYGLLIANAFLDLMHLPAILPALFGCLRPGGLFYFSLNFDGVTLLEPSLDPELDEHILQLYHATMDKRLLEGLPSGDSRTGRHLFTHLSAANAQILAAGASDWVVFPSRANPAYPEDEAYFLHFILHFIECALRNHPALDPQRFAEWLYARHTQVRQGELVYIAHQLDFTGIRPE